MNDAAHLIEAAVAMRVCIRANYNKRIVKLAPHALVTRHEELYLEAVTLEQDGAAPNSRRLGTFKLAGLSGMALTGAPALPAPEIERIRADGLRRQRAARRG